MAKRKKMVDEPIKLAEINDMELTGDIEEESTTEIEEAIEEIVEKPKKSDMQVNIENTVRAINGMTNKAKARSAFAHLMASARRK